MAKEEIRQTPGRFKPNTITLSASGGTQDLKFFALEVIIYENVLSNCIFADVSIGDSKNLIKELQLRGGGANEKVKISFQSDYPNRGDPLTFEFIVAGIENRSTKEDREQFYVLKCISEEGYNDASRVATKRFDGEPQAVLQQIYDEFVSIGKGLDFFGVTFKKPEFVMTANYWSGFRAMNYACKQNAPNLPYMLNVLFFQSDKKNYCTSLSRMRHVYKSSRLLYDYFEYVPNLDSESGNNRPSGYSYIHPFIHPSFNVMQGLSAPVYSNVIGDLNNGFMGTLGIGFDMMKRLPYHMMFDYTPNQAGVPGLPPVAGNKALIKEKFGSFHHLADGGINPIHDQVKFHPYSNIRMKLGNHNLWDDKEFGYEKKFFQDTVYRDTGMQEIVRNQISISVNGRTDVDLGQLVYLRFPDVGPKGMGVANEGAQVEDKKTSGLYQIVGIRHEFKFGDEFDHRMKLECIRDSHEEP
jgi:hypothetical protein